MFLHRYGSPSSLPIVLLHGIPGSADAWSGVVEALAPRHRLVVADLLGFGGSPGTPDLMPEAQAASLESSLRQAEVSRAVVVGHDFGGPVALSLYRRAPDLFASTLLMSTNAFPDTPVPFPLSLVNLPLIGTGLSRLLFSEPALKQMLRRYGGGQLGNPRSVRSIFTEALQNLEQVYGEFPAVLASIDTPALVLWGDEDPFFSVAQAERTAGSIPEAELRLLPGAGHFLPEQRPREVAGAIEELVARSATLDRRR